MHRLVATTSLAAILCASFALPAGSGPLDGRYYPRELATDSAAITRECETDWAPWQNVVSDNWVHFGGELASRCQLTNPVSIRGMDAVLYDGLCEQDGGEWTMRLFVLHYPDGGIDIRMRDRIANDWWWYNRDLAPCP